MTTQSSTGTAARGSGDTAVPFRLEVIVIPVADPERAKNFYLNLGWRLDVDARGDDGYRAVHMTPPGSTVSILFGNGVTSAEPGSFDGLLLAVENIDAARDDLIARGVEVSEPFHDAGGGLGGGFHIGEEQRAYGHDPQRRSYGTYASFLDSEGNRYVLQELTERLPGRV
nr:VOC family protein [uncultured Actinoplanes sp.]